MSGADETEDPQTDSDLAATTELAATGAPSSRPPSSSRTPITEPPATDAPITDVPSTEIPNTEPASASAPATERDEQAPRDADEAEPASPLSDTLVASGRDPSVDPPLDTTSEFMVPEEERQYVPQAPVVTSLRPSVADSRGGTEVTLFGAGFVAGTSVFMGDVEIVAEVIDTFTLRFVAPESLGKRQITVQAPSGTRAPSSVELSFVPGPAIRSAFPSEGPLEGGVEITIEGDRFKEGATLNLFGHHAPALKVISDEQASFILPPAGDGPLEGAIVITNRDGLSGRSEEVFRYKPLFPEITEISPSSGWITGGKLVTVRGKDFHPHARVVFGETETLVRYKEGGALDVEVPEGKALGKVDVLVIHPDGKEARLSDGFTYEPVPAPPKLIDVLPPTGLITGGQVRLVGDNFTDDVVVRIGELTAVRKVVSAKLIDLELPVRTAPGKVAIELVSGGVTVRSEEAFEYTSPLAPVLRHVEPRSGPVTGGTKITIEGDNFTPDASVRFGGEAAKRVVVKSANVIETEAPPNRSPGAVDVIVTTTSAGAGVSKAGYRYDAVAPPAITTVAPQKGTTDGGTELSIEGKNFAEGAVVLVGDFACKTKRISGSVLEAHTPEGQDGKLVDVIVKNPDGQKAIAKRAFQYDARYRK